MLVWAVSTYNRPNLLPRLIHCFEKQSFADRRMVIVDDGDQYGNCTGDEGRWHLYSLKNRMQSLGAKRNLCIEMARDAFPEMTGVVVVDDDDVYLPHHHEAAVSCLNVAQWSRPSVILTPISQFDPTFCRQTYTGDKFDQRVNRLYHPGWSFSLAVFDAVGGYPDDESGPEDRTLMRKFEAAGITQCDQIEQGYGPSLIYCCGRGSISPMLSKNDPKGQEAWKKMEQKNLPKVELKPWKPTFDLSSINISTTIQPRPL